MPAIVVTLNGREQMRRYVRSRNDARTALALVEIEMRQLVGHSAKARHRISKIDRTQDSLTVKRTGGQRVKLAVF